MIVPASPAFIWDASWWITSEPDDDFPSILRPLGDASWPRCPRSKATHDTVFHPAASLCSLAGELAVERIAVFVVAVSFWSVDLFVIQVFCEDLLEDCLSRNIFTSCQKMPFDDRLDMVEYMQKNP
jgi:hypothetical protein